MHTQDTNGATPEIEVEIHEQARTAIITLRGDHDLSTQPGVHEALSRATGQARVLVDLSECTFADSSLINALFVAKSEIEKRDGRIEVVIPPEATAVRQLVELTRLAEFFPIHARRDGVGPTAVGGVA
jgi:anti-anti-sigma factor